MTAVNNEVMRTTLPFASVLYAFGGEGLVYGHGNLGIVRSWVGGEVGKYWETWGGDEGRSGCVICECEGVISSKLFAVDYAVDYAVV